MLQESGQIKKSFVLVFPHIECLLLMYSEVAWVLVSSETQVQLQLMFNPNYLSFSNDYVSRDTSPIIARTSKVTNENSEYCAQSLL